MGEMSARLIAVAFANRADLLCWRLRSQGDEGEEIDQALSTLQALGHVAAYSVGEVETVDRQGFMAALRDRLGPIVDDAVACRPPPLGDPPPAFLMPVWPFDHEVDGQPSSTGRLLGLDLQLTATPTSDEEVGAHLPGRDGLWLIHAQPLV